VERRAPPAPPRVVIAALAVAIAVTVALIAMVAWQR
jgi:hypothetical protein